MTTRKQRWPTGAPCWADVAVPDVDEALAFYAAVLGWTFDAGVGDQGGLRVGAVGGRAAGAVAPLPHGEAAGWTLYLASDDAAAAEDVVGEHGGTVLLPTRGVGDLGRLFVAADPTGAVFGVWEPGTHLGAAVVDEPGALAWVDLRSSDPVGVRTFYENAFAYRYQPQPLGGPDYTTFSVAGVDAPLGGIGGTFGVTGMPSQWLVHFRVENVDAAAGDARAAGGDVLAPPMPTLHGRAAGLVDPAGAVFWVVQPPVRRRG